MLFSRASSAACAPEPSDSTTTAATLCRERRITSEGSSRSVTSTLRGGISSKGFFVFPSR